MDAAGVQPYSNPVTSDEVDTTVPIPFASLKDRTILITGGASGIGASIAIKLAENGSHVIIGDLNATLGEEVVAFLRHTYKSDSHHFIHLDVTSWQSQLNFFSTAVSLSHHSGIDCVIANAGIADHAEQQRFAHPPDYSKIENPPAPPYKTFNVNALGVLYTTDLALSYLSRNPGSEKTSLTPSSGPRDRHLLLVSSIAGVTAVPLLPLYTASKHAVIGLWRTLRLTSPAVTGVRVNVLAPYFTDTPILGPEGPLVMAGGSMARMEDVTGAAVRMVADKGIVGRGLMVTSRGEKGEVAKAGLQWREGDKHGNAVRDFGGMDWEQTDVFTRRMVGITNLVTYGRGWVGFFSDIIAFFVLGILRLLGYAE
jgi:NAD(P)-dependent dehydrogenase (short-subunit alcohol dehydrogenase family)